MVMEVKSAILHVQAVIAKFLHSRSTQSHILAFMLGVLAGTVLIRMYVNPAVKLEAEAEPQQVATYTQQIADIPAEPTIDNDAACVARVLYGISGYGLSANAKTAVIEVVLNRVECSYGEFGDTVQAVCDKPEQWQGYSSDGKYLKEDYDLALEVLYGSNSARVIPEGCYYLVVRPGEVSARTEWDDSGNEWTVR